MSHRPADRPRRAGACWESVSREFIVIASICQPLASSVLQPVNPPWARKKRGRVHAARCLTALRGACKNPQSLDAACDLSDGQ